MSPTDENFHKSSRIQYEHTNISSLPIFYFIYVCILTYMSLCELHMQVTEEGRGHQIPWIWSPKWLWISMWVRGTKPGFSANVLYLSHFTSHGKKLSELYWGFLKQSLIHIFAYFLPNYTTPSISRVIQTMNFANLPVQILLVMVECVSATFLLDSLLVFLSHTYKNERGCLIGVIFFLLIVFLCILFCHDANNWELWRNHFD